MICDKSTYLLVDSGESLFLSRYEILSITAVCRKHSRAYYYYVQLKSRLFAIESVGGPIFTVVPSKERERERE